MSSRRSRMRARARARHKNFKKTRVQTFGGTRKNYSKKDARKIEAAGLNFSKVTGGAKNPLNRAPTNQDVKAGDVVKPVKDFNTFLGNDYSMFAAPQVNYDFNKRTPSDISFSNAVMSGARFNEAGRNELSGGTNVARFKSKYPAAGSDNMSTKEYREMMLPGLRNVVPGESIRDTQIRLRNNDLLSQNKINPFNIFQTREALNEADAAREGRRDTIENPGFLDRILNRNTETQKMINETSSTGISDGTMLAYASSSPLQIGTVQNTGYTPTIGGLAESLGLDPKTGTEVGTTTAGGLNIGGDYGLSIGGDIFKPRPTNNRMLSEGGDLRFSDMLEADTQGAKISKGINFIKNKIPLLNRLPDLKINTVAEEAQRRYLGYNPNLPNSALARMERRGGGGTRLPMTPTVAQEVSPQTQPVPSASTTPATQTGVDPNRLLQIQQQAYAQAYNPMLIGGFNPQFRFGAATPTIDYSTYFNY